MQTPGGQSMPGGPVMPGSQMQPGQNAVQNLQQIAGNLSQMASSLGQHVQNISQQASQISGESSSISSQAGSKPVYGSNLQQMAQNLQNDIASLGQQLHQFSQGSSMAHQTAANIQGQMNQPSQANPLVQSTGMTQAHAGGMLNSHQNLQEQANQLVELTQMLDELLAQEGTDSTAANQTNAQIASQSNDISQISSTIAQTSSSISQNLSQLQETISTMDFSDQQMAAVSPNTETSTGVDGQEEEGTFEEPGGQTTGTDESSTDDTQGTDQQAGERTAADDDGSSETGETGGSEENQQVRPELHLPDSESTTSLQEIIEQLNTKTEDKDETVEEEKEFDAELTIDLEAMRRQELLNEMSRTGLNEEELNIYNQYKELLGEDTIEEMTDLLRDIVVPEAGIKYRREKSTGKLKRPLKALLGGQGFQTRHRKYPLPIKLTFLIDHSGSMWKDNRLLWVKLTAMLFLEAVFEVNEELVKKGYDPIEFELADFNDTDELLISHETSQEIGEDRKERLIFDTLLKLTAEGGTRDKEAIETYTTRLIESQPKKHGITCRKVMFVLGDGDMADEDIGKAIQGAKEHNVHVLMVPAGDEESKQTMIRSAGKEAVVEFKTLADMPKATLNKFLRILAPHSININWKKILSRLSMIGLPLLGLDQILAPFIKTASDWFAKGPTDDKNEPIPTGYRHFFYETVDNKEYLVWRRTDTSGRMHELRWQRGAGGLNVPDTITVDDDENESLILQILMQIDHPNKEYVSYSGDGKYYVRLSADGKSMIVMEHQLNNAWIRKRTFPLGISGIIEPKETGEYTVYEQGDLSWRITNAGDLEVRHNGDEWKKAGSDYASRTQLIREPEEGRYYVWDPDRKRMGIFNNELEEEYDLCIERFERGEEYDGSMHQLIGRTALGKDELIRAAAHLMNEEVYFVAGNEELEPEDLLEYQTLDKKGTGHLYTALNHVQHNGGWCVIDEAHKIPGRVKNTIKTGIEAKTHQRYVLSEGKERLKTYKNHPRARIFTTENEIEAGIVDSGDGKSDQALSDRVEKIHFVWRKPSSEVNLLYQLAVRRLEKHKHKRKDLQTDEDMEKEKEWIRNAARTLVEIALPLRLTYAGYDDIQRQALIDNNYANWDKLLKDPGFKPRYKTGKNLRRAPSPRVLLNIIEHMIAYPRTREHIPFSVFNRYFNFQTDALKTVERHRQEKTIKTTIENHAGGIDLKDTTEHAQAVLTRDSFKYKGEYLVITPEPV
ncbi:MAG: AAA domain-containing protein, partial [Elusimicrobia bacterium]|nr:AAA domain-containing protein [Elusimicrobiota bacterium]